MKAGDILAGSYELLRRIGEGGMGEVWEGRHLRIGRPVAIKVLRGELGDAGQAARLLREAQAAASVGSDHIVEVFDAGETDDGATFLVMEHLEGEDLVALLAREGPLEVGRALRLVTQICRALQAAHDRGVIHRDLKPANLFLTRRSDGAEWIKVVDFGIARVRDDLEALGEERLTRAGEILGTPHYMPPEQALGSDDVDHRADVYAIGAVLYELLTGQTPFKATSYRQLVAQITTAELRPLRSIRPDLPEALEVIVARALAAEPDERYSSAAALREALSPLLETEPPVEEVEAASGPPATVIAPPPTVVEPPAAPAATAPSTAGAEALIAQVRGWVEGHLRLALLGLVGVVALIFIVAIIAELAGRGGDDEVAQPGCPAGKVQNDDTDGHCCWPGQVWSASHQRCSGDVRCPPGRRRRGDECDCIAGTVETDETDGRCCFPGQIWSNGQGSCAGAPSCPEGWQRARQACVPRVEARGDWIPISAATFTMGSSPLEPGRDDDEEEHEVALTRDLVLMATEVTQKQFEDELGYNPSFSKRCGETCPVEGVSWHEAAAYTNSLSRREKLAHCYDCRGEARDVRCAPAKAYEVAQACPGYRLPTEAEWELAARAGTTEATYGGDLGPGVLECERTNIVLQKIAWFCGNARRSPQPVGTLEPNQFGLYDMLGNVWEWCHDVYRQRHDPRAQEGARPGEGRVIRGGSWSGHAARSRAASRDVEEPTAWRRHIGFRVAKSIP